MAKIRIIMNGVHFYSNTSAINKRSVGDNDLQNVALKFALDCMGKNSGIGRDVHLYDHKMTKHTFQIQLSVV
jgi:hypothetical protein